MDKATVKIVLSAYRQGCGDENDPLFAEALRETEHDPELGAWFAGQQHFDAVIVRSLQEAPTPAGLKDLLLLNARSPGKPPAVVAASAAVADRADLSSRTWWNRRTRSFLALAACCVFAFVLGRLTQPAAAPAPVFNDGASGDDGLGLRAIAYTSTMPALQFVCFDAAEVAQWVDKKSAAIQLGKVLDKPLGSMQMIGSSAAQWEGKPVIMIALQNGGRMAMLYLVRASDFPGASGGAGQILEKDGWVSKTGRKGDHFYVLTTKGTRENLNFPMPL